jgi:hypothetical protein
MKRVSSDTRHPAPEKPGRGVAVLYHPQKSLVWSAELFFQGGRSMEGKNRFTPKQVNKALRLLRDLPVKDGRKSIRETLRQLEQGMRDALEKGYSRGEIQQTIAEAEIVISATTLKGFLAEEPKEAGQKQVEGTVSKSRKTGQSDEDAVAGKTKQAGHKPDAQSVGKSESFSRKQAEASVETISPGGIIVKPDTPKEEL